MTENNTPRSYGQGAQGEPEAPKPQKTAFAARLRYSFDNSIAKSRSFVGYLFLAMIIFSAIIVLIKYVLYAVPFLYQGDALPAPTFETFWGSFASILGHGGEATWADRIVGVLYWVVTVATAGAVTGFIVGLIGKAFEALRKGRTPVIDHGHTLILGWSNRVFPILKELDVANENVKKPVVVIFANLTRDFMEVQISDKAEGLKNLKIVTRTGDPTTIAELKRANVSAAKSVIILDSDGAGDANAVNVVLAVKAVNSNPNLRIIAEIDDKNNGEALEVATKGQVISVRSQEVIARVTAQASRQPGLAAVTLDLLDFAGDEIYFQNVPALAGKTYKEALSAFNGASVIGLVNDKGQVELNPKQTTKLTANTKVIAVAEDDDQIIYTGISDKAAKFDYKPGKAPARKSEHLLFIGWSAMGRAVLTELAAYLPKGSTVHIVAQEKFTKKKETENLVFGDIKATFAYTSGDIHDLITAASAKRYDEVIVLGYREKIAQGEADAQTMLTMLQMNQLFETDGNGVEPTRLVVEILDSSKAELARVAAVDDLVVSDNLAALLIAQISENPALAEVFEDLFDAEGASINMKSVDRYAPVGKSVTYGELVAAAAAQGESAIGLRIFANKNDGGSTGVVLNPNKNDEFKLAAGDSLVVIGSIE